jgi:hypothetical protein
MTTITRPVISAGMLKLDCIAAATELACTMLPMPNAASDVSSANTVPSQGRPRPFFSTYIAPPRIVPAESRSR